MWAATRSYELVIWTLLQCSHSKICNLDLAILCQQYIFGLEVAVTYIEGVTISYGTEDLSKASQSFFF